MKTAEEARDKTRKAYENLIITQINLIDVKIDKAISCGETMCCVDFPLCQEVIEKLKKLGYGVRYENQYNDEEYCISW